MIHRSQLRLKDAGCQAIHEIGKGFRQALHDLANELISLPDSPSRVIDKTYLNGIPADAKLFGHIGQKQRSELLLLSPHIGGCGRRSLGL